MLKKLAITNGRLVEVENDEAVVYVYIAPDESERRYLVDVLKMDEHTLNSSLDPEEQSRLEFEPDHAAMIFKRPKHYSAEDNFLFKIASTGIFIFQDKLIIVVTEDTPLFEGKPFLKVASIQDVMLKLIYRAIVHFVEHLRGINMMSDSLEHQINQAMENKLLLNLFTLEKSLVYYLNAINSNAMLIEKIKNSAAKFRLTADNLEFLDDVIIENNQCREQASIYSQVLAGLMDARASIVSNNLNVRMKTLTLVTISIMLPTFVVSLFSMNVPIPHQHAEWMFALITSLAGFSAATVIFFWWNKKW
ncbi:MAG: divalent metal ion transporter [Planctomycetes bacterium GWF2_42_9]|nr:MAG: divalent metal ion transporter [Planctomycetes bacterium GWF2_42_9]